MKKLFIITLLIFSSIIQTQATVRYYFYIQLKDKNNTTYSLSNPLEYLSQRALDRRAFFHISIDSTDLPVNANYISQIKALNFAIHNTTKWLNGVTVETEDSASIANLENLSFVKFVQFTGRTNINGSLIQRKKIESQFSATNYGSAATQINQLKGAVLHNNGYRGEGMQIAVIDAGFLNVKTNPAFDSLRNNGRLLGTKDFVNPQSDIYTENYHGAHVLSTMAADIPNEYVGTAPKASYWLIRSEANNSENLCEVDFWVSAIEFADSVGVDVSTTSLGYTKFDDSSMNFSYADMDGQTARASIAATLAVDKGIMVLNSAGNDGDKSWKYIGVPADADKIITVGAVTSTGLPSSFSSFGPTSDGRIKPELCAMGTSSALISTSGTKITGDGTSYACPILAGVVTCFLQAVKDKRPTMSLSSIRDILYQNANLYSAPTAQMGYGIPDFQAAYNELLLTTDAQKHNSKIRMYVTTNNTIKVNLDESINGDILVNIYTLSGQKVYSNTFNTSEFEINNIQSQKGVLLLNFSYNNKSNFGKIIF